MNNKTEILKVIKNSIPVDFQKYKNFSDFKEKMGMNDKEAIMFLLDEIEKIMRKKQGSELAW